MLLVWQSSVLEGARGRMVSTNFLSFCDCKLATNRDEKLALWSCLNVQLMLLRFHLNTSSTVWSLVWNRYFGLFKSIGCTSTSIFYINIFGQVFHFGLKLVLSVHTIYTNRGIGSLIVLGMQPLECLTESYC